MAYMLAPIKSAVIEFSKSFPDIAMAKEINFEMWGHDFAFSLGLAEDDQDIVAVIEEAWDYFNNQDKKEWVEWAGTILMPKLHAKMEMKKAVARRVQVEAEGLDQIRKEEQKWEQERLDREAEFDWRAEEIRQAFKSKKIDSKQLRKAAEALELERVTMESVAETPATTPYQTMTQDNKGEDKVEDDIPESTKVKVITPSSSKRKGRGDGSTIYAKVSGLVRNTLNYFEII
jgi:hypothetical protein